MTGGGGARSAWIACVDAGNSRTKLYAAPLLPGGKRGLPRSVDAWEGWSFEPGELGSASPGLAPSVCLLSSVASPEDTRRLRELLGQAWGQPVEVRVNPDCGLELRIEHPSTVGADRLFAARGALDVVGRSCIVVDAGTALTVDALEVRGAGGAFLGGAIAPGPDLLAESLLRRGARLAGVRPEPGARALGRHTEEALLAGVVVGFEGAALRLVRGIAAEAGLDGAGPVTVVLCGGAAAFLREPLRAAGFELREAPELVATGLLASWQPDAR